MFDLSNLNLSTAETFLIAYGLPLLYAVLIFVIGRILTGWASRAVKNVMVRSKADATLTNFLAALTYYAGLTIAIITAINVTGVGTASLAAVLGAVGLAIGFALQGSLANFAAGVMILLFRPYKIGDLVELSGTLGHVTDIEIFNTVLLTPDAKTVIVPNAKVTDDVITNLSKEGHLRVDLVAGIGYGDDLLKAKAILQDILASHPKVLESPAASVDVLELADSSVNFAVRPYAKVADYWTVYFDVTEQIKLRFDEAGIEIPFPQTDVHLHQTNG